MQATSQSAKTMARTMKADASARRTWLSVSGAAIALIGVRWGAWVVAAFYVLPGSAFRAEVPVYVEKEPTLLIIALVQTIALTGVALFAWPRQVKRNARSDATQTPLLLAGLFDFGLAVALVYLSGGWGTPFYHLMITSLIVPAFLLRPSWAALLGATFAFSYVVVLYTAGLGPDGDWDDEGRANLFGHLMTGVLVIAAVQFLASVTRELARERDEKQTLAAQEERARIAREIHDGIAQSVYMLSLNLETTAEKAEPGSKTGDAVRELVPLSKQILMEVRHYIFDLKPLLEGGQSLQEALSNQTKEFASVTGISIGLSTEPTPDTLTSDASIAIYRTVQEALANAYRHGAASHVSVNLAYRDGFADLVVEDDGTGFDVGERANGLSGGYGLRNMEERALDLGGFVEIESDSGKGTRVRMALPFDA